MFNLSKGGFLNYLFNNILGGIMSKRIKNIVAEAISDKVQEAECVIHTSTQENLTDVLTSIRAIAGVTIVNLVGSSKRVSDERDASYLKIKFIPNVASSDAYVRNLVSYVRNLPSVFTFEIKKVENLKQKLSRRRKQKDLMTV
jgi:nitrate reductase NapAB chaperone NapD